MASNGNWLNADPTGLAAGPNPYDYVGNNPTNAIDSNGLDPKPGTFIICDFGDNTTAACNYLGRGAALFAYGDTCAASNVKDGVDYIIGKLADRESHLFRANDPPGSAKIQEVSFWGHGRPGCMSVGGGLWPNDDSKITVASFTDPENPTYEQMKRIRERLTDDAVIYFKGCSVFSNDDGRAFADAAAVFFGENGTKPNRKVMGHNAPIGYGLQYPGCQTLRCNGEKASWENSDPSTKRKIYRKKAERAQQADKPERAEKYRRKASGS